MTNNIQNISLARAIQIKNKEIKKYKVYDEKN